MRVHQYWNNVTKELQPTQPEGRETHHRKNLEELQFELLKVQKQRDKLSRRIESIRRRIKQLQSRQK